MNVKIKFDNQRAEIVHFPNQEGYDRLRNQLLLQIPGSEYFHKVKLRRVLRTLLKGKMRSGDDIRLYAQTLRDRPIRSRLYQLATQVDEYQIDDVPAFIEQKDKEHGDDGYVCLIDDKHTFLTGLLPKIIKLAEQAGLHVELEDCRNHYAVERLEPKLTYPNETVVSLRDYQMESVRSAFLNGFNGVWWPRGILKLATGAGKSRLAVAMYQMTKVPSVFLVHRRDLLQQAKENFESFGIPVGVIDGKSREPLKDGMTIATLQTLWSRMKRGDLDAEWLASIRQMFLDEAHLLAATLDKANTFVQTVNLFPNAYLRWGLTATPFMKEDDFSNELLRGVTGEILVDISNQELIGRGYLVPPEIRMVHVVHPATYYDPFLKAPRSQPKGRSATWAEVEQFVTVASEVRNKAMARAIMEAPKPCLVLVRRKEHIRYLNYWLNALGQPSLPSLTGEDSKDARRGAVKKLNSGQMDALITTSIFDVGVDIPQLRSVIMGAGGKSHISTLQRTGRGLRKPEGKDKVIIYDFVDASIATPTWNPAKHSRQRRKFYKDEGFVIKELKL